MPRKGAAVRTRHIIDVVREICLALPDAEEIVSHGSPNFRAGKGKLFASYTANHHGDGRIALWLAAPPGSQQLRVENEPEYYFVPPYVGPRGWLGVHLNRGLSWTAIAERVREAFLHVASAKLTARVGPMPRVAPPDAVVDAAELDPLQAPRAREVLAKLQALCLALPETSAGQQFGSPAFRAGKRVFCLVHAYHGCLCLQTWVGVERQAVLTLDARYRVPAYTGHNGWIELDVEDSVDWQEVRELVLGSYRHFALARMLKALPAGDGAAPVIPPRRRSATARRPGRR